MEAVQLQQVCDNDRWLMLPTLTGGSCCQHVYIQTRKFHPMTLKHVILCDAMAHLSVPLCLGALRRAHGEKSRGEFSELAMRVEPPTPTRIGLLRVGQAAQVADS